MELIYITLAVYGMGAATALFPKKMEMAAHYCAVLAAVFGSGALLYQSAAYMMQGSGSLLRHFLLSMLIGGAQFFY